MKFEQQVKDKSVLFITTKNLDYLRNTQEIRIIEEHAKECKVIGSNDKKYVKRLIHIYWNLFKEKTKKFDCVFIGFAPQLILPVMPWKFKKNFVLIDFFISMFDTFVCDRQKFKPNSLIAKIMLWLDKKTLKKADMVICDTKAHGKYFCDDLGCGEDKIEVLYLEGDASIYYPRTVEKKDHRYMVLYFGSILPLQGVDIVLGAADLLKDDDRFSFEIIGPTNGMKRPEGEHIRYYEWLSQTELAEHIAASDLCLAGHFNKHINKALRTIPGKAYIYETMEKKMILGENSATHELYSEDEKHFFVEMGSAKALADKIVEVYQGK